MPPRKQAQAAESAAQAAEALALPSLRAGRSHIAIAGDLRALGYAATVAEVREIERQHYLRRVAALALIGALLESV